MNVICKKMESSVLATYFNMLNAKCVFHVYHLVSLSDFTFLFCSILSGLDVTKT